MEHRRIHDWLLLCGLVTLGVATRWLPHPYGVTSIGASALLSGAVFARWWLAPLVPWLALALSDVALGGYPLPIRAVVYLSLAAPVLLRPWLHSRRGLLRIALCTLAGTALFYVASNFAVWAFGQLYPPTAAGLASCYLNGLPFLSNSIAGDLLWSFLLFAAYDGAFLRRWRVEYRDEYRDNSLCPVRVRK
jgi:hypothetical protein